MCSSHCQTMVIVHTNDTHSQIDPYSYKKDVNMSGFLRREAAIREIRAENVDMLLLDAGDFSQGTPYFNVFKGYVEVRLMNAMGYDAATLGNHEFDNGCAALAARLKTANFPVVCANYQFANKKLAKVIKPYVIVDRAGIGRLPISTRLYAPAMWWKNFRDNSATSSSASRTSAWTPTKWTTISNWLVRCLK